jgi:hypothetical protein
MKKNDRFTIVRFMHGQSLNTRADEFSKKVQENLEITTDMCSKMDTQQNSSYEIAKSSEPLAQVSDE